MKFTMNHIHLRAKDAKSTAQWYVDNFGADIVEEVSISGNLTVRTDIGGARVNVSQATSLPFGTSDAHMGLEHFGLETDNLDGVMASLKAKGIKVLEPVRTLSTGMRISYVEAPDNVRLELMQPS